MIQKRRTLLIPDESLISKVLGKASGANLVAVQRLVEIYRDAANYHNQGMVGWGDQFVAVQSRLRRFAEAK